MRSAASPSSRAPRASTPHRSKGYGRGTHAITGGDLALLDPAELAEAVFARFAAPDYEPPVLPSVAIQLLELSRKSTTSFRDVQRLLEQEPLLTGRVLRLARSAAYGTREPVRSLEQAISRLGIVTMTHLFLQVSIGGKVFRAAGFEEPMAALRRHSIVTAHLSKEILSMQQRRDDEAFLAGLLHDAGIAASIVLLAEVCGRGPLPHFAEVRSAILEAHVRTTGVLARAWKLPADLATTLAHHHAPFVDGRPHARAAVLCVADGLAGEVAPCGDEWMAPTAAAEARRVVGLSHVDVERLRAFARQVADGVQ